MFTDVNGPHPSAPYSSASNARMYTHPDVSYAHRPNQYVPNNFDMPYTTCPVSYNIPSIPHATPYVIPHTQLPTQPLTRNVEDELNDLRQQLAQFQSSNNSHSQNQSQRMNDSNTLKKLQALPRWNIRSSGDKIDEKNESIEDYISAIHNFIDTQEVSENDLIRNI